MIESATAQEFTQANLPSKELNMLYAVLASELQSFLFLIGTLSCEFGIKEGFGLD
jgi:hypothetical protein